MTWYAFRAGKVKNGDFIGVLGGYSRSERSRFKQRIGTDVSCSFHLTNKYIGENIPFICKYAIFY
jgi:hypothetical protein